MKKPLLSFIVPCYNEEHRISRAFEAFEVFDSNWGSAYEIVFVNDGSSDKTFSVLDNYKTSNDLKNGVVSIVSLERNSGKGAAIREGVLRAKGEYILTLDADMSTTPSELEKWKALSDGILSQPKIYIGSRTHHDSIIEPDLLRKYAGLTFNLIVRIISGLRFHDTQCGYKLYPGEMAKRLFGELTTMGWAHDIEILLRAKSMEIDIVDLPVEWHHIETEKISVIRDGWKMIKETVRISKLLKK